MLTGAAGAGSHSRGHLLPLGGLEVGPLVGVPLVLVDLDQVDGLLVAPGSGGRLRGGAGGGRGRVGSGGGVGDGRFALGRGGGRGSHGRKRFEEGWIRRDLGLGFRRRSGLVMGCSCMWYKAAVSGGG